MHNTVFLTSENELNKILRSQRKTGQKISLLFVATWDKWCNDLVNCSKATSIDSGTPLYIINSFTMPHAFVIFNTTKLPHLIRLGRDKTKSEDYLPHIYRTLGL